MDIRVYFCNVLCTMNMYLNQNMSILWCTSLVLGVGGGIPAFASLCSYISPVEFRRCQYWAWSILPLFSLIYEIDYFFRVLTSGCVFLPCLRSPSTITWFEKNKDMLYLLSFVVVITWCQPWLSRLLCVSLNKKFYISPLYLLLYYPQ